MDQPLTLIHLLVARHVVNRLIFSRNSKPYSMMTVIQPKLFDAILWYLLRWYCSSMADITMSLDGFIGGPNYDIERFHDWLFYCKTEPPGWQILFSPVFGYQYLFFLPLLLRVWTEIWLRHIRDNIPRYWYYNKGNNKSGNAYSSLNNRKLRVRSYREMMSRGVFFLLLTILLVSIIIFIFRARFSH